MVQFEYEILAAMIGAVTYCLYLLFPFRALFRTFKTDKKGCEPILQAEKKSDTTIVGEPSPEPQPEDEECNPCTVQDSDKTVPYVDTKAKYVQALPWHWMITGLVFVCLALFSCNLQGSNRVPPRRDVMDMSQMSSPIQEAAPVIPSEASLAMPDVPEVLSNTGATAVIPSKTKEQEPVISWKLTREALAIQRIGGRNHHRSAYWGEITVGTPPVKFKVVFDTGSGQFIVPTTYCKTTTCRMHARYSKRFSSTGKDIDYDGTEVLPGATRDQIEVTFGTGEISGVFYQENVCIERSAANALGTNFSNMKGSNENILGCMDMRIVGAIDMPDDVFKAFEFDGILGLGLEGLSQTPEFNFVNMMGNYLQAHGSKRPHTFAVFLADDPNEQSEITFGGWVEDQHEDELVWAPVQMPEHGHWMVGIKSLLVDGEELDFCKGGDCRAVMDTGTSLLAVPKSAFKILFNHLKHSSSDPTCHGSGPTLQFDLGEITLELEPTDYAMPMNTSLMPQANITNDNTTVCKPMMMAMEFPEPVGPRLFIMGEPVLRKYHTVYDADAKQIGFSRALHNHAKEPDDPQEAEEEETVMD